MSQSFLPNQHSTEANHASSRTQLRQILLQRRQQALNNTAIHTFNEHLRTLLEHLQPRCLALYWPIREEFDPRPCIIQWSKDHSETNPILALPKASSKNAALCFLEWYPDMLMSRDAYGIPTPQTHTEVHPDLILLPCLGFAKESNHLFYRLGYGAGSYDRTLAHHNALRVGMAYEFARLPSIAPQPHDLPLDYMVTEMGYEKSGA